VIRIDIDDDPLERAMALSGVRTEYLHQAKQRSR